MTRSDPSVFSSQLLNQKKKKERKLPFSLQPATSTASNAGCLSTERAIRAAITTLGGCLLCLSSNRRGLMKTKHFRVKAFAARVGLSDLGGARPDFILKYHRRACQYVKASATRVPPSSWGILGESQPDVNARNGESIWWENPLLSLNPLLVELPFTVVIAPQASTQAQAVVQHFPQKKLQINITPLDWGCDGSLTVPFWFHLQVLIRFVLAVTSTRSTLNVDCLFPVSLDCDAQAVIYTLFCSWRIIITYLAHTARQLFSHKASAVVQGRERQRHSFPYCIHFQSHPRGNTYAGTLWGR